MSLFLRTSRFAAARPAFASAPSRAFGTSAARHSKESDLDNPDNAEQYERHKQDLLKKQKEGKGHWKPELASNSEEAVAADRHKHGENIEETLEELQKRTVQHAEKKHKHGTSQDPGM